MGDDLEMQQATTYEDRRWNAMTYCDLCMILLMASKNELEHDEIVKRCPVCNIKANQSKYEWIIANPNEKLWRSWSQLDIMIKKADKETLWSSWIQNLIQTNWA